YLHAHGWAQGIKPTGTNTQHVICDSGCAAGATQAVTGTFWQATQPVSGTFWQATQPVSGTFWQATQPVSIASMPSTPVTGTFWQATQPVSGTVTTTPPANASTNVTQFGGTNVSTGTGAGGLGIPRVTISNDSSLAANQSVNVAQIAGATTSTAASGVQKVG